MSKESTYIVSFFNGKKLIANPAIITTSVDKAKKIALTGFDYGYKNIKRFDPPAPEKYTRISTFSI